MPKSKNSKTSSSFSDSMESALTELDTPEVDSADKSSESAKSSEDSAGDKGSASDIVIGVFYPLTADPGQSSLQHLNINIEIVNPGVGIAAEAAIASDNAMREAVASDETNSAGQLLDTTARTDPAAEAAATESSSSESESASSAVSTDSADSAASVPSASTASLV